MSNEKTNKTRKHSFVDRFPVIASILLCFLGLAVDQTGATFISTVFPGLFGSFSWILDLLSLAIVTALILFVYKWWFRPEFSGMMSGNIKDGFIMLLCPILVYWILNYGYTFIFERETLGFQFNGSVIRTACTAGVVEELCFRGLLICTLLRIWRKKDGYLKAAVVSAIVFGLIHAGNAATGADLGRTALQVIDAGFMGLLFAGVFIRCGSLIPAMVVHSVHDIIAIGLFTGVSEQGIITGGVTFSAYFDCITSIGLGVYGLYLLRKSKLEEVRSIWDEKWRMNS